MDDEITNILLALKNSTTFGGGFILQPDEAAALLTYIGKIHGALSDSTDMLDNVWSNTGSLGAKARAEANRGLLID